MEKHPLRVLIAEDNADDAELIVRALRQAGFDPEWHRVDSEADYLAHLHAGLDVILSDFRMPQFGGFRALEILHEQALEVPFILISGTIGEEVAVAAMKLGAADYLLKDRLMRLGTAVWQALEQSALRRQRERTEQALRVSEERLKLALASSRMGVWEWDARTSSVFWSPECVDILGAETCSGTIGGLNRILHPDDAGRVAEAWSEALASQAVYAVEFRILLRGETRWIANLGRATYDERGQPIRMIGTTQDITQRKLLEEQLRQSQKMEAIGQLASGVAHDFNNLLTVIQGNASLVLLQETPPATKECVEEIVHETERAAALTRQLLLFSRKQAIQPVEIDLNSVVENMTKMLQRTLGEPIELAAELSPHLPLVQADAGMIEQIVLNLAVNARDAMPAGGRLSIITHSSLVNEDEAADAGIKAGPIVCLTVSDTGSGIPPEVVPRIFDPFFTTKRVGAGTGLGLATVYGIVKQHGGSIDVQTAPGQGTTFRISLPARGAARPSRPALPPENLALPRGTETILLVEDEPTVRSILSNACRMWGYKTLLAESGSTALGIWAEHKESIQLVLTDIVLPGGLSGQDLIGTLLAEKPGLKVIYTSGYNAQVSSSGTPLVDGVNFLQKPFNLRKLASMLRVSLELD